MKNMGTMELIINIGKSDTPGLNDKNNYQVAMTGWGWVWSEAVAITTFEIYGWKFTGN